MRTSWFLRTEIFSHYDIFGGRRVVDLNDQHGILHTRS